MDVRTNRLHPRKIRQICCTIENTVKIVCLLWHEAKCNDATLAKRCLSDIKPRRTDQVNAPWRSTHFLVLRLFFNDTGAVNSSLPRASATTKETVNSASAKYGCQINERASSMSRRTSPSVIACILYAAVGRDSMLSQSSRHGIVTATPTRWLNHNGHHFSVGLRSSGEGPAKLSLVNRNRFGVTFSRRHIDLGHTTEGFYDAVGNRSEKTWQADRS